jgi:Predicted nucleoside-diphosphate-sugar epimerases
MLSSSQHDIYAVTGITGKVGGALGRTLLASNQCVRALARDAAKARGWAQLGCEVAVADMTDVAALTAAFSRAKGVFILPPSEFDPAPGFPHALAVIKAVKTALDTARPGKVVCLSTIGAQAVQLNLLTQRTILERELSGLAMPVTFLRPAWFMENFAWDVAAARDSGVIASFLQPLDKPVPMVASADVGRVAAELIQEDWRECRIVELEAAQRITPNQVAAAFARILGHDVRASAVPRENWHSLFKAQGMKHPLPRMQMLDGFNQGWIEFEHGESGSRKGELTLEAVLTGLIEADAEQRRALTQRVSRRSRARSSTSIRRAGSA